MFLRNVIISKSVESWICLISLESFSEDSLCSGKIRPCLCKETLCKLPAKLGLSTVIPEFLNTFNKPVDSRKMLRLHVHFKRGIPFHSTHYNFEKKIPLEVKKNLFKLEIITIDTLSS